MKVINKIFTLLFFVLFFVSCQKNETTKNTDSTIVEKKELTKNLNHIKVDIKGMTCEIGCARLIQSKLYKTDGITFAKISFADSSGVISFDQNRISTDDIKKIIQKTAGGDIYSVVGIEEVKSLENSGITQ